MRRAYPLIFILLFTLITTGGCSSLNRSDAAKGTRITSDPSGATVYAAGNKMGTTPLVLPPETFPTRLKGLIYQADGTLTLKKEGCRPYSHEVDDTYLNEDVQVRLDCGPEYTNTAPAAVNPAPTGETKKSGDIDPVEHRLQRLEKLYNKGVISDEEYREARKRIIEAL